MNSDEMMKKIGLRKENDSEGKNDGNLKSQTLKYLKEGKNKIMLLEKQILSGKKAAKILKEAEKAKLRLEKAKITFDEYEKKAEAYIEKNPKKAVAIAAAAGVLAGSIWMALGKKKPVLKLAPKKKK